MEIGIVQFINHLGAGKIDAFSSFISWIPFVIAFWLISILLVLLLDKKDRKVIILSIIIALAFHFLFTEGILKHLLILYFPMRVRPYLAFPDLTHPIGQLVTNSSFPSSHMSSSVAVLTVLVIKYRKLWPYALIFTLLMAFSRIHNGMHYPTDVVAGGLLGLLYGIFAVDIATKVLSY